MGLFSNKPNIHKLEQRRDVRQLARIVQEQRDPTTVSNAVTALVRLSRSGETEATESLAEYLGRVAHNGHIRYDALVPGLLALDELTKIRHSAAAEHLVKRLSVADPELRSAYITTLGEFDDGTALEPLIDAALSDPDSMVRRAAISALQTRTSPRVASVLMGVLNDSDPAIRLTALRAFAASNDPGAVGPLLKALSDPEDSNRYAAISALAEKWSSRAGDAFVRASKDRSESVRTVALGALADSNDPAAVDPLISALSDSDTAIRRRALDALAEKWSRRAGDAFVLASSDENAWIRSVALRALAKARDPRAAEIAGGALGDSDDGVRETAVQALVAVGADSGTIGPLTRMASADTSATVRLHAVQLLGRFADARVLDTLTGALSDPAEPWGSPRVLDAAEAAIRQFFRSRAVPEASEEALRRLARVEDSSFTVLLSSDMYGNFERFGEETRDWSGLRLLASRELARRGLQA